MKIAGTHTSLILAVIILAMLLSGCTGKQIVSTSQTIGEHVVTIEYSPHNTFTENMLESINEEVNARAELLDPLDGDVLGRLNTSEVGELIPMGSVASTLTKLLEYTSECYGAYDPTLQILWDVYDFDMGGRNVSDAELADALQWVDYHQIEIYEDSILRKGENIRMGLGPAISGAIADWYAESTYVPEIENIKIQVDNCVRYRGEFPDEDLIYEFNYPLNSGADDENQQTMGYIRLNQGECLAAIDDGVKYFFRGGEMYHMVLDPITGLPVRSVRAVAVISTESCLEASVAAYAVMVMGPQRGIEFLNEVVGIEGLIMDEDGHVTASGGMGDNFWR